MKDASLDYATTEATWKSYGKFTASTASPASTMSTLQGWTVTSKFSRTRPLIIALSSQRSWCRVEDWYQVN
ncbi:Hypothetical protein FKW44_021117 [Caligus rogercresseyi]|uniref:Uncharacterized protein n=1 Tax=Caligus rogercresseyi TaxID=217165 RepID=A0A7T8GRC4_CALRO|nr:Hypothetical protein FKW44_021117 [Caligus rogercresseyi]